MEIDLNKQHASIKKEILTVLIPAFPEKVIMGMTKLPRSTISYYRTTYKIETRMDKKRNYEQEAKKDMEEHLEHNAEFALNRALEICADNGIGYE